MARLIRFAVAMVCMLAGVCTIGMAQMGTAYAARFETERTPNGTWVHVRGNIMYRDGVRFIAFLNATPDIAMVVLGGTGGMTDDAVQIGGAIRARQLSTLVRDRTTCTSACAIAWLGGAQRFMEKSARIGFHMALSLDREGNPVESQFGNGMTPRYLSWMGLPDQAIAYLTGPSPGGAGLDLNQVRAIGIAAELFDPEVATPNEAPASTTAQESPVDPRLRELELAAREFAVAYFNEAAQRPEISQNYFRAVYADTIFHNGTRVSREQVMDALGQQAKKWPEQSFVIRPDSVTSHCNVLSRLCEVAGITDWEWSSWGRGARANGSSRFWFQVSIENSTPLIRAETVTVLNQESTGPE